MRGSIPVIIQYNLISTVNNEVVNQGINLLPCRQLCFGSCEHKQGGRKPQRDKNMLVFNSMGLLLCAFNPELCGRFGQGPN